MSARRAVRSDWTNHPMPAERSVVPCDFAYDPRQMELIQHGLIPQEMEDKWFIFWEDGQLHFHRSWTGNCTFEAKFDDQGRMFEFVANRHPEQYTSNDAFDLRLVPWLIKVLLLHEEPLPEEDPYADSEVGAVSKWSQVGRAMLGDHPNSDQNGDSS